MTAYAIIATLTLALIITILIARAQSGALRARNTRLNTHLIQAAEQARAADYRANLHKKKLEESEAARKRLRKINANLAAEIRQMEGYNLYLRDKLRLRILEELLGMAVMDSPYYPRLPDDPSTGAGQVGGNQINLN